jgi:biopolymer transport protein ExbD
MRLSKHRHQSIAEMNMTPMIDVTFQLIIFFMACSQVSKINEEKMELPKQQGSQDQPPTSITVNVNKEGQIIVSARQLNAAELVSMMADEIARQGGDAGRVNIVLRADARGTCRAVNEVVKSLAKMQLTRIRMAVEVPQ